MSEKPKPKKSTTDWVMTGVVNIVGHLAARVVWELVKPLIGF